MMWRLVCRLNGRGSRSGFMFTSCGMWLPLVRLQLWQHATRFSHVDVPPRERGITWSSVSSAAFRAEPQYWQVLRSRSRMFLRESARVWCGMRRYSSRRMTEGTRMAMRAAWRKCPFSSSVMATPFNTSTMARRAAQTLIGSYEAFRTSTGACITEWRGSRDGGGPMIRVRGVVECLLLPINFLVRSKTCSCVRVWRHLKTFALKHARNRRYINPAGPG